MKLKDLENYINKILVFYSPDKAKYWNSITKCVINKKPEKLGRYYLDFISKAKYTGKFSKNKIPLTSYKGQPFIEHPTVIAQYALGVFEILYQKNFNDEVLKNEFNNLVNWFIQNKVELKSGKGWTIDILYPEYGIYHPWISAMTQGEVISVLVRGAMLFDNPKFEELAVDALSPFTYEVKDGGLVNYFNSIPVYEEAPTKHKTSAVLNGFIFSLFGLYDLYLYNKNDLAFRLFSTGINSLKNLLSYYDIGYWTRYRLMEYPGKYYSSFTYHILVIEQLKALYYLTDEKCFMEYSKKWTEYSDSFFNRTR